MSDEKRSASRRDFLKLAATGAPAAAVAAVVAEPAEAAVEEELRDGLRPTEHSRKYYETARF